MEAALKEKIERLKKEKNAIILAHYYAPDEVQAIADFIGDSFYLAKTAKNTDADVIVFAGVSFMGESAKILNPKKTVLMPDISADCPMAHMVKEGKIEELRNIYPDLAVVCYINSTSELKSRSDVCVTSSNAASIVKSLPNKNVFFIPDMNLGRFVAEQVPEKNVILNDGCCPIHHSLTLEELKAEKARHPSAKVLTHPECREEVVAASDFIGSTADIINYAKASDSQEFIICTEEGVLYKLLSDNPSKHFYFPRPTFCCADMKLNTPERIAEVLENGEGEVCLTDEAMEAARKPLEKMLEMAK